MGICCENCGRRRVKGRAVIVMAVLARALVLLATAVLAHGQGPFLAAGE